MAEIQMPQLGETVTEGTITKWFKQVGETVAEDEAAVRGLDRQGRLRGARRRSPGVLTEILVPEGDTVDVGTVLAVVGDAGGRRRPRRGRAAGRAEAAAAPAPSRRARRAGAGRRAGARAAGPARRRRPPRRRRRPRPRRAARAGAAADGDARGQLLSPVVRRLVTEHGLDPATITGTGPGGRITRNDVLSRPSAPASAPAAAPAAAPPRRPGRRLPRRPPPRPAAPAPARPRRRAAAPATPSSRSTTSGAAPPSTW